MPWLKQKYLSKLSKFKIIDNLRRSLVPIFAVINLIFIYILNIFLNVKIGHVFLITIISVIISSILDLINYVIFRKENIKVQKKFTKRIDGLMASIYRGIIELGTLPFKAWVSFKAIIKTIYRMKISKEHLLEWTTAEEAEKGNKKDLLSMYKNMTSNVVFGILGLIFFILVMSGTRHIPCRGEHC